MPLTTDTAAGLCAGGVASAAGVQAMRIRATRNTYHHGKLIEVGQEGDLPEDEALALLAVRKAVVVDTLPPEIADAPAPGVPESGAALEVTDAAPAETPESGAPAVEG